MSVLRKNIPQGKTRVIVVDIHSNEESFVEDFDTPEEAFRLVDAHNILRKSESDSVHYAYDSAGNYLRGDEAVEDRLEINCDDANIYD